MDKKEWQKELHEQIGILVHNHAKIEHGLSIWISNLAYVEPEIGLTLTSEMSCRLRINALLGIIILKTKVYSKLENLHPRIEALVSTINILEGERNKYAHSSLLSLDGNSSFIRAKYVSKAKGLKLIQEDFTLDDLKKITKKQDEALSELSDLFHLSKKIVKPLPRKIQEQIKL